MHGGPAIVVGGVGGSPLVENLPEQSGVPLPGGREQCGPEVGAGASLPPAQQAQGLGISLVGEPGRCLVPVRVDDPGPVGHQQGGQVVPAGRNEVQGGAFPGDGATRFLATRQNGAILEWHYQIKEFQFPLNLTPD